MTGGGFKNLVVWRDAKNLAVEIYQLTRTTSFQRDRGLGDQLRRAAVSAASNIAEGDERMSNKESARFFFMAKGSVAEVRTQLEIAFDIGYLLKPQFMELDGKYATLGHRLGALIKARLLTGAGRMKPRSHSSQRRPATPDL